MKTGITLVTLKKKDISNDKWNGILAPIGSTIRTNYGPGFVLGYSSDRDVFGRQLMVLAVANSLENINFDNMIMVGSEAYNDDSIAMGVKAIPQVINIWGTAYNAIASDKTQKIGDDEYFLVPQLRHGGRGAGKTGSATAHKRNIVTLTKDELWAFVMNQRVAEVMREYALSDIIRKNTSRRHPLLGNCTGTNILFREIGNGELKAMCAFHRINYMSLVEYKPNSIFIANRNFISNKKNSKGKIVAYLTKHVGSKTSDVDAIEKETWSLGCIVHMTIKKIAIATMVIGKDGTSTIPGAVKTFDLCRDLCTVHYLNWCNMDMTGPSGDLIASGLGPSIRPYSVAEFRRVKQTPDQMELKPVTCESFKPTFFYSSPLIERLVPNSKGKLEAVITFGARIVVVSGPLEQLAFMNSDKRFFCPLLQTRTADNPPSSSFLQEYELIQKDVRKTKDYTDLKESIHAF